ncbi:hypothetical protein ACFSCX_23375 [Bacillus salitolerans]|uniref:Uncharacterized protein n=1 Tax=Bacillus salitolerans TaxID=1437434 RepID=A0ABW4LWJ6_9BACI
MFLEEEVYGMLHWGFLIVMFIQLLYIISLWKTKQPDRVAFIYLIVYLSLFSLAGVNLLQAINTFEHQNPMGSETASLNMGYAGILWSLSVLFLLRGISRLIWIKR